MRIVGRRIIRRKWSLIICCVLVIQRLAKRIPARYKNQQTSFVRNLQFFYSRVTVEVHWFRKETTNATNWSVIWNHVFIYGYSQICLQGLFLGVMVVQDRVIRGFTHGSQGISTGFWRIRRMAASARDDDQFSSTPYYVICSFVSVVKCTYLVE